MFAIFSSICCGVSGSSDRSKSVLVLTLMPESSLGLFFILIKTKLLVLIKMAVAINIAKTIIFDENILYIDVFFTPVLSLSCFARFVSSCTLFINLCIYKVFLTVMFILTQVDYFVQTLSGLLLFHKNF
ncbi:MAG: hypothetical protein R3B12_00710 [Candidatus Saccharimonadales bacterium]